ncbi:MAG: hypothetical protein V3V19_11335 [Cocleimonas sp.]
MSRQSSRGQLNEAQAAQVVNYVDTMIDKRMQYEAEVLGRTFDGRNPLFQKKTSFKFRTTKDLLATYYPHTDSNYLTWLSKADDPITSTEAGFVNIVYGSRLWQTQDLSANILTVFPHAPWAMSGWNYAVDRHATGGGQTEGAVLPDTDYQTPEKYNNVPKEIVHTYEETLKAQLLSRTGDDNIPGIESQRPLVKSEHMRDIDSYLTQDFNTLAGVNVESLDRLTATTALRVAVSYDDGDEDIFGIDKSASTDLDPYVDHNSDVDRDFSFDDIDTALAATRRYRQGDMTGGQFVLITGPNMLERMNQEAGSKQRFVGSERQVSKWAGGFNGMYTVGKEEGGYALASYRDYPIIEDTTVTTDTLERIYGIYLSATVGTFLKDLLPTTLFASNDYIDLDAFKNKEALLSILELESHNPRANFQLRDYK